MLTSCIVFTSSKELKTREKRKNARKILYDQTFAFTIPRGLTVRIAGFHPAGPGSTPGVGTDFLVFLSKE